MSTKVKTIAKISALALGAATLAAPAFAPVAQEHDHSAHAEDGDAAHAEIAPLTEAEVEASRTLFSQYGCGSCHALADANGYGSIGPSLDGSDGLTVEYVNNIVTNGQGAMPSFGGMVGEEDLEILARYIVEYKAD